MTSALTHGDAGIRRSPHPRQGSQGVQGRGPGGRAALHLPRVGGAGRFSGSQGTGVATVGREGGCQEVALLFPVLFLLCAL